METKTNHRNYFKIASDFKLFYNLDYVNKRLINGYTPLVALDVEIKYKSVWRFIRLFFAI